MRLAAAAAIALTATGPCFANGPALLEHALRQLPEVSLEKPSLVQFYFVNIEALHALAEPEGRLNASALLRPVLGGMIPAFRALQISGPNAWNEKALIDIADVRYMLGIGEPPIVLTLWGLQSEAAATDLIAALDAGDFEPVGQDGMIGNGEQHVPNLQRRDSANPWRTEVGAATFAVAKGDAVMQSTSSEALSQALVQSGAADNPIMDVALTGLEAIMGDDLLVQAMVISPLFGLRGIDPSGLLTPGADFETMKQTMEERIAAGAMGIPPYFGGVIADVEGDQPAVAISLTYGECQTAETAAGLIAQRWTDTMPPDSQGDLAAVSVAASDGLCAATLMVSNTPAGALLFPKVFDGYVRQNFSVLNIGEAP